MITVERELAARPRALGSTANSGTDRGTDHRNAGGGLRLISSTPPLGIEDPTELGIGSAGECGTDDDLLRTEVDLLLAHDAKAAREGFLGLHEGPGKIPKPRVAANPSTRAGPGDRH